jgi:hypothetical protein
MAALDLDREDETLADQRPQGLPGRFAVPGIARQLPYLPEERLRGPEAVRAAGFTCQSASSRRSQSRR